MSEDTPVVPDCIINVFFDLHRARFSYSCNHCCRGWQVDSDGNIFPPPLSRIIQFRLKAWPAAAHPFGQPVFAGFQVVKAGEDFPATSVRWYLAAAKEGVKGVSWSSPNSPPAEDATLPLMTFDFGDSGPWSYRLAVIGADGRPRWDDPKIHNDGSTW